MGDLTDFLQCPITGRGLHLTPDGRLAADGGPSYSFRDGVACLLPEAGGGVAASDASESVRDFYETEGWAEDDEGLFGDTKAFVDTRAVSLAFTRKCMARLSRHFSKGGRYLLDAGSGAIPHKEVLAYGDRYEQRVCVDLATSALRSARSKLGERGVYVQGDLTNLPFKAGSFDAVTCNHVIYQIPLEHQPAAFCELWRVLKPGGVAVVVYLWSYVPLARRLERLAQLFMGKRVMDLVETATPSEPLPELSHHPQRRSWFEAQDWPFRYTFDTFRIVDNAFLRSHISDDWRGRAFLRALFASQQLAPGFCGKYGAFPAIIIHKD